MDSDRVFAGVDLSTGRSGVTVALISGRLEVHSVRRRTPEEAAEEMAACEKITAAFGGPLHSWRTASESAEPIGQALREGKRPRSRAADGELSRRGIPVRRMPVVASAAPAWMRSAFGLARALAGRGFAEGKGAMDEPRALLETHPGACAAVLLGRLPFGRTNLEGRIQRQLLLIREKMALPDPMRAFEEMTAHHILSGRLALDSVLRPDELDALLAAFTAWRASTGPESVTWLGDDAGGWICLPAKELSEKYTK